MRRSWGEWRNWRSRSSIISGSIFRRRKLGPCLRWLSLFMKIWSGRCWRLDLWARKLRILKANGLVPKILAILSRQEKVAVKSSNRMLMDPRNPATGHRKAWANNQNNRPISQLNRKGNKTLKLNPRNKMNNSRTRKDKNKDSKIRNRKSNSNSNNSIRNKIIIEAKDKSRIKMKTNPDPIFSD